MSTRYNRLQDPEQKSNFTFYTKNEEAKSNNSNNSSVQLLGILNEKIKFLEIENKELKNEIIGDFSEKEKIQYHLRLRKELLEEIERLKTENDRNEINFNTTNQKLKEEILNLTKEKIDKEMLSSPKTQFNCSTKISEGDFNLTKSPKFLETKISNINVNSRDSKTKFFIDNEGLSNFSGENILSLNGDVTSDKNLQNFFRLDSNKQDQTIKDFVFNNDFKNTQMQNSTSPFSDFKDNQETNRLNLLDKEIGIDSNNPYMMIIHDLEDRIKLCENIIKEKDNENNNLKNLKEKENQKNTQDFELLQRESDSWKAKYLAVLGSKKSVSEEYTELFQQAEDQIKKETANKIKELEKKIIQLEKFNHKLEQDTESITTQCYTSENYKQSEVDILKLNNKAVIEQYECLYKTYEENTKNLIKQIDSLKQLYAARETEFINITNYYIETVDDYSKPITELNKAVVTSRLEEKYIKLVQDQESLKKQIESLILQNGNLRTEIIEARPKMRQKIANALTEYDDGMRKIVESHSDIGNKLEYIVTFMKYFDEKFVFFNSLIEDNRKLSEKVNSLECQLKMVDIDSKNEEIFNLKESNLKLTKELELKNLMIREFDDQLNKETNIVTNVRAKNKSGISPEIVMKLKSEISHLTLQVASLNKTKDSVEKFYQTELKNIMESFSAKNTKIEELKSTIAKMENDFAGKKATIYNLWMLEFKEFKNNLITIVDIKSLVEKFKVEGEELTEHKDRLFNEELYLLRQEIKIKDDIYNQAANHYSNEKKNLFELMENYKNDIESRITNLNNLTISKEQEVQALKAEKLRLIGIQSSKKNVIFYL